MQERRATSAPASLLEAAVEAGVPRFISSDYSLDFTKTPPSYNRNSDLRRKLLARADQVPIRVISVLGTFMDMLGAEMPIIQPRLRRVLYWADAEQPLDLHPAGWRRTLAQHPDTRRQTRRAVTS